MSLSRDICHLSSLKTKTLKIVFSYVGLCMHEIIIDVLLSLTQRHLITNQTKLILLQLWVGTSTVLQSMLHCGRY